MIVLSTFAVVEELVATMGALLFFQAAFTENSYSIPRLIQIVSYPSYPILPVLSQTRPD
jgi:hypothetical protein